MKHIALLVIVSLTAIFIYQAHWLLNMYRTNTEQTQANIRHAIRNADYIELMMRTDSVKEMEKNNSSLNSHINSKSVIAFSATFDRNSTEDKPQNVFKQAARVNDSTYLNTEKEFNPKQIGLPEDFDLNSGYQAMEFLAFQVQTALHSVIDVAVAPINIFRFDSLLNSNLNELGIHAPHFTRIVRLENDSTLASTIVAEADTSKMERFEYVYDAQEKNAFHVYIQPTNRIVLRQMSGILATSLLILIVLGGAFLFLIRTIMQQKTLDEMKTDFTNNITHEFKTPIAVAYAANDALLNFNQSEDKNLREKYLTIAQEQLQKLSGMVEQILSMSMENRRTFQLKPERIEVLTVIHSLVEQHRLKADKPLHVEVNIQPETLAITTDRIHLNNIISNLIDNAVKYSKEEALVIISARSVDGKLQICIEDNGIGIPHDKQKHIFDKFYRVPTGNRHDVKGYGLGLYYVKTMMEKMGGTIELFSEPGKGSRFTIML